MWGCRRCGRGEGREKDGASSRGVLVRECETRRRGSTHPTNAWLIAGFAEIREEQRQVADCDGAVAVEVAGFRRGGDAEVRQQDREVSDVDCRVAVQIAKAVRNEDTPDIAD